MSIGDKPPRLSFGLSADMYTFREMVGGGGGIATWLMGGWAPLGRRYPNGTSIKEITCIIVVSHFPWTLLEKHLKALAL